MVKINLEEEPETELEYWKKIRTIAMQTRLITYKNMAQIEFPEPTGKTHGKIKNDLKKFERWVGEVKEKFGVILPQEHLETDCNWEIPPVPEGKIHLEGWSQKMEKEYLINELIRKFRLPLRSFDTKQIRNN